MTRIAVVLMLFALAIHAPLRGQEAFGLGLTGVGNINDIRSLGALTVTVHLGRVR